MPLKIHGVPSQHLLQLPQILSVQFRLELQPLLLQVALSRQGLLPLRPLFFAAQQVPPLPQLQPFLFRQVLPPLQPRDVLSQQALPLLQPLIALSLRVQLPIQPLVSPLQVPPVAAKSFLLLPL